MPLKLIAPLYETFELTETDKLYENEGDPTTVTIKQAAQHEHERRQQLFSTLERRYNEAQPEEVALVQTVSFEELKRQEVFLTLVESNIEGPDGEVLFPSRKNKAGHPELAMTSAQFNQAWGKLPPSVANEIHDKVVAVNIIWSGLVGE